MLARDRVHTVGKGSFLQFCAERLSAGTATDFFSDEASGPRLRTLREHAPPRRLLASSAASSPPLRHPFATHSTHHPASTCLPHLRTLVVGEAHRHRYKQPTGTDHRVSFRSSPSSDAQVRSVVWVGDIVSILASLARDGASPRADTSARPHRAPPSQPLAASRSLSTVALSQPLSPSLGPQTPSLGLRGPQPPQPPPAHYPSLSPPWHLSAFQASARSRRACTTWAGQRE